MNAGADQKEMLAAVDAAWLRMDRPCNLMMICGMLLLDAAVDLPALRALVRDHMLCFHRFRQRVVDTGAGPYWETDPDFDLDWHVRRVPLAPGGPTLEELTSELISTALDARRPMWQFHLIETADAGALVMRIHHCYGDGFAMLHLLDALTEIVPGQRKMAGVDLAPAQPARSAWERVLGSVGESVGDALRELRSVAGTGAALLADRGAAIDAARSGADLVRQAAVIANMAPDAPSRLKGELGVMKRAAWTDTIPLEEFKAVAAILGCSVNDILMACTAGALRAYLDEAGDPVGSLDLRALVPVNLRPPGPLTELGNHFGLVFLDLPVGIDDPVQRALEAHLRMESLKQSRQPLVAFGILAAMGVSPAFLRERILEALAANASVVVTNVRGSAEPRYLAGRRIMQEMFWVPQSGGIGIGISLLSYAGQVSIGVVADARRVPDPAAIPRLFAAQFEALLLSALMLPWPGQPGALASRRPRNHR